MEKRINIHLIGVGSVGSMVALLLSLIGRTVPFELFFWDHDSVVPHNPTNQLYRRSDVGTVQNPVYKVNALKQILQELSEINATAFQERVNENTFLKGIVVVAVDSMTERKKIFSAIKLNAAVVPLYIEARSGGTLATIYALDPRDPDDVASYEKTIYTDKNAAPAPCAEATTVNVLFVIAAVISKFILSFLKDKRVKFTESLINFQALPTINTRSPET